MRLGRFAIRRVEVYLGPVVGRVHRWRVACPVCPAPGQTFHETMPAALDQFNACRATHWRRQVGVFMEPFGGPEQFTLSMLPDEDEAQQFRHASS